MLTYEQEPLTEKEQESIDQIVNILVQHVDFSQERPQLNAAINVSVAALSRILAPSVPPQSIDRLGNAIGHAIKLNVEALRKYIIRKTKEQDSMPS